jgi:hypothetical protein
MDFDYEGNMFIFVPCLLQFVIRVGYVFDRLCNLLIRVPGYSRRGPELDSRRKIF